jgi:hypothetical protein
MAKQEDKLTFAAMILVAIVAVVGIIGLSGFQGITGAQTATDSGTAKVNISGTLSISLTQDTTDFGTGYVNASSSYAEIYSGAGASGKTGDWINDTPFNPASMVLENNGTITANVTINATSSAATFIGGANPEQKYNATESESTACGGNDAGSAWLDLTTTETNICDKLFYQDTRDEMTIDYWLNISNDAPTGQKSNTIVFTAYEY